jgi:hypothetical protein
MTKAEPGDTLRAGTAILDTILAPHGFIVGPISSGAASGGSFAWCEYCRGNRRLRLHFRYSLGLVEYELGGVTLSHEDFMWSVQGRRWATNYPGFSKDPLDGFRHLAADLTQYAQDFLTGSDNDFIRHADRAAALKRTASRLPQ